MEGEQFGWTLSGGKEETKKRYWIVVVVLREPVVNKSKNHSNKSNDQNDQSKSKW